MTRAVLEDPEIGFPIIPLSIPCARRVETRLVDEIIVYRDGMTGSHLAVGGME